MFRRVVGTINNRNAPQRHTAGRFSCSRKIVDIIKDFLHVHEEIVFLFILP